MKRLIKTCGEYTIKSLKVPAVVSQLFKLKPKMTLNILNNISIYTVQWFTKDLGLDKNPLLLFKANEFKFYKKGLKGKLGVYAFFCMTDGKYYIGSYVDLRNRLSQHLNYDSSVQGLSPEGL